MSHVSAEYADIWRDERSLAQTSRARRGARQAARIAGMALGVVWVVFLAQPWQSAWAYTGPSAVRAVSLAAIGAQACLFVWVVLRRSGRPWSRGLMTREAWWTIAAQLACVALSCAAAHSDGLVGLVFIGVGAIILTRDPQALWVTAASVVVVLVVPRLVPGWDTIDNLIPSLVLAPAAVFGFVQLVERNRALTAAQREVATLAVERERERIARDMHDILGHSLTVVAVKAELAVKVAKADPDRAAAEMAEVQALARSALADVRAMVTATRAVTLAGEIAGARAALEAAGIEAQLPGAVDQVPEDLRELFAWTVREGTTNVLRHSAASRVTITIDDRRIAIDDDGRGPGDAADETAHGLRGLRERAERSGARVEVSRSPLGGYRLRVSAERIR